MVAKRKVEALQMKITEPYFTNRGIRLTPDQPWPDGRVSLHHPVLTDYLIVPTWTDGQLQLDRLNALQRAGYAGRLRNRTDDDLHVACRHHNRIYDHTHYFEQGDDRIVLVHGYPEHVDVTQLQAMIASVADRWSCELHVDIDPRFNIYMPACGTGFEVRRHKRVRAKGMFSWLKTN